MPISDQVMRDLREVVRANRGEAMSDAGQRLVFRVLPSLLDEVESLRDRTLQKDFLALYRYARAGVDPHGPHGDLALEGLQLQVDRLAPLHNDVAMQLDLPPGVQVRTATDAEQRAAIDEAARAWPYATRSDVPRGQHEALPLAEVVCQLVDAAVETAQVTGARVTQHGDTVQALLTRRADGVPLDPAHMRRVLGADGTVMFVCDHKFLATSFCVRCRKPFAELRAEADAELAAMRAEVGRETGTPPHLVRMPDLLPDGVLRASPDELADIVARQLDEHEGRGIINREALDRTIEGARIEGAGTDDVRVILTAPPMHEAFEDPPPDELAVPIVLGTTLRPRVEALVATGKFSTSRDLSLTVQTLFVLGMLAAEGQDPHAHVGEPMLHVSAEALFVRFGMPHEGGAAAAQQRADILRRLFLDLVEWCDEVDPLRASFAAALAALPR